MGVGITIASFKPHVTSDPMDRLDSESTHSTIQEHRALLPRQPFALNFASIVRILLLRGYTCYQP